MWPLPLSSHPVLAYAFAYAQKASAIYQGATWSTVNYIDSSLLEDEVGFHFFNLYQCLYHNFIIVE